MCIRDRHYPLCGIKDQPIRLDEKQRMKIVAKLTDANFRMQTPAGWSTTHFRERYASTTKWSMTIIACVKRF